MWRRALVKSTMFSWSSRRLDRYLGPVMAAVVLGALTATPASAFEIDSTQVVVPVIVHTQGYNSTVWRSDVWVTNTGGDAGDLTLTYYPAAGGELTQTMSIGADNADYFYAYASVVRDDTGDATFLFGPSPNTGIE